MDNIIIGFNIKKRTYLILFLLLIGLIVGPFYSVVSYYNLSKAQSSTHPITTYGTQYDTSDNQSVFEPFTKTIQAVINYYPTAIQNSSLYALVAPAQDFNGSFHNYATIGTYELLEVNFTNNFQNIETTNTYNLTSIPLHSNYHYDGIFFDENQFWTYSNQNSISLLSFNKQGLILANHSLSVPTFKDISYLDVTTRPLGFYNNQFWRLESGEEVINNQTTNYFNNITAYSLNTFSRVYSRTFNNFGPEYLGFIDNNMVWFRKTTTTQPEESYYGFSMQEIMNSSLQLSTNQTILMYKNNFALPPYIQSIDNFEMTSYGWSDGNFVSIASIIYNNKIIQIYATPPMSSFDQTPIMLLGVVLNSPVVHQSGTLQIGTLQMVTFVFGYVLTGVMTVIFLKMDKKKKKNANYIQISNI